MSPLSSTCLPPRGWLVNERSDDGSARHRCAGDGDLAARQARRTAASREQFQRLMADHGVICSMSRSSNVWDNAAMGSPFSSLKTERIARELHRNEGGGQSRRVQLYRTLLQSQTATLDDRISEPNGVA